ncbi:UNVERIFIED_CONTAM: hypothetical protein RMT77_007457 [Armadillidium vulgare]|nr:hypothetical protein Avbf_15940 [Armadillidium vulgare]
MATLGAPVKVSPLIKTVRWTGLVAGILYGSMHYNTLSRKEAIIREEEAKLEAIRSVERQAAKDKANREELEALAKQMV